MKADKVNALKSGVYRIFWRRKHGGGYSLAAVGQTENGSMWHQSSNWTSTEASTDWSSIKKVKLIEARY